MIIEFKCDCGCYHCLEFDDRLNLVGRTEKYKKVKR